MKRTILVSILSVVAFSVVVINPSQGATSKVIKNCVRINSGEARLVNSATKKCRTGERLVSVALPALAVKRATQIYSGKGIPSPVIGLRGDFYIDEQSSTIFGPKVTDTYWPSSGISFIGKPGAVGPIGATGLPGEKGEKGDKGDKGDTGATGAQGPPGATGATGAQGAQGSAGATGATGATGAKGDTGAQGEQGLQGPTGAKGDPGGFGSYGSFYDTTTVSLTQNQVKAIPLGVTDFASGISIENDALSSPTKIRFSRAGKFNIAFSLQLIKSDAGTDITTIWICKGSGAGACTNQSWTSTDLILQGNDVREVAAWNFFVNVAVNDYIQLLISPGTSTATSILSSPAQTNPTRPEIPSTIVTVNQVG